MNWHYRDCLTKNEHSVTIYSPLSCSKPNNSRWTPHW